MAQQQVSAILNSRGEPFPASRRARADGSNGPDGTTSPLGMPSSSFPYQASEWSTQEMGNWLPVIRSPDAEINMFRDRMVARSRDMARNSGWAAGGISRILDNVIGTNLRLSAKPDYRSLALRFGVKAFDSVWADEYRHAVEALWRNYSESDARWNDVSRQQTTGQQFRLTMRHELIDGESLVVSYWKPDRVGYGWADYATCFLVVDPDRLSNPWQKMDTRNLRGGVEIDDDGVPLAYHVRKAEQNDWYNAIESNTWERIEREDEDGWRRVIHSYDLERAGQHRGLGVFTPVLNHMRMLATYYGIELQSATIASMFGNYVTSPYDPALVQDALGADDDSELPLYQNLRAQWAQERPALLSGARLPTLAPGEEITSVSSQHPHTNFSAFAHEMLCVFASAAGISVEQVTQDWSKGNYSGFRAGLMETWKTLMRRRNNFATNTATPMYGVWLQEPMERGELPLPAGAPAFVEASTSYSRARWLGPARGWIDPTKEPAGSVLRLEAGISTLEQEAAEQGVDWEEVADQRAIEIAAYNARGVPPPKWAAMQVPDGSSFFKDDEEKAAA